MLHLRPVFWRIFVSALAVLTVLGLAKVSARVPLAAVQTATQAPALAAPSEGVEVRGTARPADTVRLTQGETLIGQTVAGEDGTWQITVPEIASPPVPLHVQVLPAAQRGTNPEPEPVSIAVIVIVGANRVEVRVQVTSNIGTVDIDVSVPIVCEPCNESTGQGKTGPAAASAARPAAESSVEQAPQPTAPPQSTYHTVTRGETLAVISARYGVSAQAIMQANRIRDPNLIFVGQRLVIPTR